MLSRDSIRQCSVKWQTTEINVTREYLQHLFLSALYLSPRADHLAFKGGTALRIAFGSPRFSEDLDFSSSLAFYHFSLLFAEGISRVKEHGIDLVVTENKSTSGGHLAIVDCSLHGYQLSLTFNVSLRRKISSEAMLITSPLVSPYQCLLLKTEALIEEKVEALLSRKKPRDYFDLYFLLRERRSINTIIKKKSELLKIIEGCDPKTLFRELKQFLPASHHRIASNLPEVLKQELERL